MISWRSAGNEGAQEKLAGLPRRDIHIEGDERMKTIAIDIDDTINNFGEVLAGLKLDHKDYSYIDAERFDEYVDIVKRGRASDGENIPYIGRFLLDVHRRCFKEAKARLDAIKFVNWLKDNNWRIIVLTYRDLRGAEDITKEWLRENGISYDYIFSSDNKPLFCKLWGIDHLIDDTMVNLILAPQYGVNTYYPINVNNRDYPEVVKGEVKAIGFNDYSELYSKFEVMI